MKNYTRTYMRHFGYRIAEDFKCELTGSPAHDIHHIDGRGKGKDTIENLMAVTREVHADIHDRNRYTKEQLREVHQRFMKNNKKK